MLKPLFDDWRYFFGSAEARRTKGYLRSTTGNEDSKHHFSATEDGMIYKTSDVVVTVENNSKSAKNGENTVNLEMGRIGQSSVAAGWRRQGQ